MASATIAAMPLPTIGGTVRVSVQGNVSSGQKWVNVWHLRYAGGASTPGPSDIDALDALFVRMYNGAVFGSGQPWLNQCNSFTTLAQITYLGLDGAALAIVKPHTASGTASGPPMPPECAPVLTLRSAIRGRSHRGRVYLPAPANVIMDGGGRLGTGTTTATVAQVAGLKAALGGPTLAPFWELGIASYLHSYFTPLNIATMDVDIDVQRRRKN